MRRLVFLAAAAVLALVAGAANATRHDPTRVAAAAYTKTEHSLQMGDGVALGATLYTPAVGPSSGGWPGVLMLHGLGGDRRSMNAIAEEYLVPHGYAVLTVDARGHGASGGQSSLAGARELADYAAALAWFRARPGVSNDRIGALGVSLGGGSVWKLLTSPGTQLAAAVPITTWTSLYDSLLPQGLGKSGLVAYLYSRLPPERWHPDITALKDDALLSRNAAAVREAAAARSVRSDLARIRTPVFMIQGRRDFAFDMEEALAAFARLRGPKRLYLGNLGHAPATNPSAEQPHYLTRARMWFDRFLKDVRNGIDTRSPIELAPDPWRPSGATYHGTRLPARRILRLTFRGRKTIDGLGEVVRTAAPTRRLNETFGNAVVSVRVSTPTGWPHLVAVLSAVTPDGREIVVSQGGAVTSTLGASARLVTIRLLSQATTIPRGSRLRLTLAASSTAQDPNNLLYIVSAPPQAQLAVGEAKVVLPVLRRPVSRAG